MNLTFFPESTEERLVTSEPLRIKFGIDPTSDRLHLGHFVPIDLVAKLKSAGHHIDIVLGTLTGRLGDPSGQDKTRPILSFDQVLINANRIMEQVKKIMPSDNGTIKFHFNHRFMSDLTIPEFLIRMASKFTVAQMLARDGFRQRSQNNQPIALHEFLVPLLQGWDSVVLKSDIEIGGSDQLFNFQVARQLQEAEGQKPEGCIMTPLIRGKDGRKMSKSLGNTIFLDETPHDMFGQVMSIPDAVCNEWTSVLRGGQETDARPMEKKLGLAELIVLLTNDLDAAKDAARHFRSTVQRKKLPDEIPEVNAEPIIDLIIRIRNESKSKARDLIRGRGVSVNGEKINSFDVLLNSGDIVKIGKRTVVKIK